MDHPCKECDKANNRKYKYELFKCEKPCRLAKAWKRCNEDLIDILSGKKSIESLIKERK